MTSVHPFELVPQSNTWVSIWSTLGLLIPLLLTAAVLFALYWVIRKAVAGGVRDARGDRAAQEFESAPGRGRPRG